MLLDPNQFLGLTSCGLDQARAVLLPLPLEETVSYGKGTGGAPRAILDASLQIEFFDEETGVDFEELAMLHTLPPLEMADVPPSTADPLSTTALDSPGIASYLTAVRRQANSLRHKFLLALGGEHTISYGMITGLADDPAEVTIVQIDAHADLIEELDGRRWSHGTVMRRLWERGCRLVQIGVRSLSRAEYDFAARGERIEAYYAHQLAARWPELLARLASLEGKVYLSLDVDGLDPAVVPSTGTPQPNGLTWQQTIEVIRAVAAAPRAEWIGADVVEFVPSPQPPGCDLTVARLVMKVLAWHHSASLDGSAQTSRSSHSKSLSS